MRVIIKSAIVFAIVFSSLQAAAQNIKIVAGLNLANQIEEDDNSTFSEEYVLRPGFHAGATFGIPLVGNNLSIQTGLLLSTRGSQYNVEVLGVTIDSKLDLYYIDVPVFLRAAMNNGLYVTAGPYFAMGVIGRGEVTETFQGVSETQTYETQWGNDSENSDYKRRDYGVSAGIGVEFGPILAGVSYDLGLSNNSVITLDGRSSRNNVLKVSVGFILGK